MIKLTAHHERPAYCVGQLVTLRDPREAPGPYIVAAVRCVRGRMLRGRDRRWHLFLGRAYVYRLVGFAWLCREPVLEAYRGPEFDARRGVLLWEAA